MPTINEINLVEGDVFRPRGSGSNGFMTMIVVKKEDNLLTVHRPFCYGIEQGYRTSTEIFSYYASSSFSVDLLESRRKI